MTLEESKTMDIILKAIQKGPMRPVNSWSRDLNIDNSELRVFVAQMVSDGFVREEPKGDYYFTPFLTDSAVVHLKSGGYENRFIEDKKVKDRARRDEARKNRNDTIRTWATIGSCIIGGIALGKSFWADKKIKEANESIKVERDRIDNMVKETSEPFPLKYDSSALRKFIEFMNSGRKTDALEKK